jgi:hypothetical protein
VIGKVLFILQRTRFIIPAPNTSIFDFILLKKLWMKGIFYHKKIGATNNIADMLTKVVLGIKFQHCLNIVNITQC